MADNQTIVNNLISGKEFKDTRLASLLQTMANDLYGLQRQINPPTAVSRNINPGGNVVSVSTPIGLAVSVFQDNIRITWNRVASGLFLYELRLGNDYDTATILLTTASYSADIDPVSRFIITGATYTFWLTTIDDSDNRSDPASVSVAIPNITAPVITSTVVGNNVLLQWTEPTSSFRIDHYIVAESGTPIGTINGTFDVVFEPIAGTYNFTVQAVDIVGNLSTISGTVTIILNNPTDFVLVDSITSTFSGTKSKTYATRFNRLLAVVDTKTWHHHFLDNSFASIQAQITAGYPKYYQPGPNSAGTYQEIFDFGSVIDNVIVGLSYNIVDIAGVISIQTEISVSDDNITYTSPVIANSLFATSLRYAKIKFTFTPADGISAIEMVNLVCSISVKYETDQGTVSALSTDASGTPITFNKTFHEVSSVALTPQSSSSVFAVYNTLTATGCKVFVYNILGVRVSATVTWVARGIL